MKIDEPLIIQGNSDCHPLINSMSSSNGNGHGDGDCGNGYGNGNSGFDDWYEAAYNCLSDNPDDNHIQDKNFGIPSLF